MILYNKKSMPTARLISSKIEELSGKRYLITSDPKKVTALNIRYGNSSPVNCSDTEFNSPEAIRLLSFKKNFCDLLLQKNFYAPKFRKTANETPKNFPVIIRSSLSLSGGKGIFVAQTEDEFNLNRNIWWTDFVRTDFELRLHLLNSQVVRIVAKILRPGEIEEEFPIRVNRKYRFSLRTSSEKYKKAVTTAQEIAKIIPARFFVLDMGWDSLKREYFIYEGNSAPGLDTTIAEIYARFFIENNVV